MTNRWSNARQSVIDSARALVTSKECTYGISTLRAEEMVVEVKKLLDDDTFHFGKSNTVSDFLMRNRATSPHR